MTGQRPISVNESWEAMMFKRIDHVEIVTDQLTRTAQFYTEVLGFTVKARDRIERSGLGVPIDLIYLDLGGKRRDTMKIPQAVREVIDKGPLAHLTTLNPNGSPQVTVVWVGIDGEEFVMGHLAIHQKVRNIRRDPRVALSLLGYNTTQGMREYVVVYGTARVADGGAVPLLQRLAPIYIGPGAEYPPASMRNIAGYVTRITPARLSGIGPWAQRATG
jgi:PPOX class probable F420-dependent enzyme